MILACALQYKKKKQKKKIRQKVDEKEFDSFAQHIFLRLFFNRRGSNRQWVRPHHKHQQQQKCFFFFVSTFLPICIKTENSFSSADEAELQQHIHRQIKKMFAAKVQFVLANEHWHKF